MEDIRESITKSERPSLGGELVPSDMNIRQKVWQGAIPMKIDLSLNDINSLEKPESLYVMAPRMSYLSFFIKNIRGYFDSFAPIGINVENIWFEYNNIPLKWNIPIGVLFDLIIGKKNSKDHLPWCLVFHYRGFPEDTLLSFKGIESIRFNYINSLKESMYLRTGSSKDVLNMQKSDEASLFEAVLRHNFDVFWRHNLKLCNTISIKQLPIRIYINKAMDTFIQQGGSMVSETYTLGEYLSSYLPNVFTKDENNSIQKNEEVEVYLVS